MKEMTLKKAVGLVVICIFYLAFHFLFIRSRFSAETVFLAESITLAGLVVAIVLSLLGLLISLLRRVIMKNRPAGSWLVGGEMVFLFGTIVFLVLFVAASQWAAHTPPIRGEDGKPLPGSIASLEKVRLGGVDQWLIIRGQDVTRPVLLFLSGGPGASEAARVLRFNQELEKHFVVVIWEQRGCGKSYPARADLTVEQYTSDVIELSEMLRARFDQQKIYLVGHSWGTIIGVRAAQARPDLFHAYVGTSQMVDVRETDQLIYQMVLEHARNTGDTTFVRTLEKQGPPPYFGKSPIQPYATLFGREYAVFEVPNIQNEAYRRDGDVMLLMLKQPEYGWLDRLYYLLGLMNTFNKVYSQLQELDFRLDAIDLELPVHLILGRHDMNNPSVIPDEYFQLLRAPSKQLYYFEKSGHGMIWEEASRFHEIMINLVQPKTYYPQGRTEMTLNSGGSPSAATVRLQLPEHVPPVGDAFLN